MLFHHVFIYEMPLRCNYILKRKILWQGINFHACFLVVFFLSFGVFGSLFFILEDFINVLCYCLSYKITMLEVFSLLHDIPQINCLPKIKSSKLLVHGCLRESYCKIKIHRKVCFYKCSLRVFIRVGGLSEHV